MPVLYVTCVNKTSHQNPTEQIQNAGGVNDGTPWKLSQPEVIRQIESGENEFRMAVNGHTALVIVATVDGKKYIRTEADRVGENKLLLLPECL